MPRAAASSPIAARATAQTAYHGSSHGVPTSRSPGGEAESAASRARELRASQEARLRGARAQASRGGRCCASSRDGKAPAGVALRDRDDCGQPPGSERSGRRPWQITDAATRKPATAARARGPRSRLSGRSASARPTSHPLRAPSSSAGQARVPKRQAPAPRARAPVIQTSLCDRSPAKSIARRAGSSADEGDAERREWRDERRDRDQREHGRSRPQGGTPRRRSSPEPPPLACARPAEAPVNTGP